MVLGRGYAMASHGLVYFFNSFLFYIFMHVWVIIIVFPLQNQISTPFWHNWPSLNLNSSSSSSLGSIWIAKDAKLLHVDSKDSDCVDVQAHLSLCWSYMSESTFFLHCGSNNLMIITIHFSGLYRDETGYYKWTNNKAGAEQQGFWASGQPNTFHTGE